MENKKSKKKLLIIAAVILLLIVIGAMGFVIYRLMNKEEEPVERAVSAGLVVDAEVDEKVANARFTTDMNMIWTFPSGSRISNNAIIGNSSSNVYECYFEVYLDDEAQTLLYSSPVLPVGKRLDVLRLDKTLDDGSYDAVCTYHLLDDEDPERELGTVSFSVTLLVMDE